MQFNSRGQCKSSRSNNPDVGQHHWLELDNNPSLEYIQSFEQEKIIYPEITKFMPFYYDENGYFCNNKCYILTGEGLAYLTTLFNSKLFDYCFRDEFPLLLGGTRELRKVFFEKLPIKKVSPSQNSFLKSILLKIQILSSKNQEYRDLDREIDLFLYHFYELNYDQVLSIDPLFDVSKEDYQKYLMTN